MSNDSLEMALKKAKDVISEQNEILARLSNPPTAYGTVIRHDGKTILAVLGGQVIELVPFKAPVPASVKPGSTVKVALDTTIAVAYGEPSDYGETATVKRRISPTRCEVDHHGSSRIVVISFDIEDGDVLILDPTNSVATRNLGKAAAKYSAPEKMSVSWTDIGGQEEAKSSMIEAVEMPHMHREAYARYGKKPLKGLLLYGPPGCGKTMLAKAAATSIQKAYNGKAVESSFMYVKGPELLDRFVGNTEATIRSLFLRARDHKKKHGFPAVLFIDEADALLGRRGRGISSDMERTIVPQFLSEMDGLDESGCMVVLATNRADELDPAIVRDGRIDRKVYVGRPQKAEGVEIFKIHLAGKPMKEGRTVTEVATQAAEELYSPAFQLVVRRKKEPVKLPMSSVVNGAMIAGIVDRAASLAIHREIKTSTKSGISDDDLKEAMNHVSASSRDLNFDDEVEEARTVRA